MTNFAEKFLNATIATFNKQKEYAESALVQLEEDDEFFRGLGPRSHSIAITVKHVGGNLRSRWLNFLTTDGEKEDQDRDNEFSIKPG